MDVQQLVNAVQACLNPDASIRNAGEQALKQVATSPGGLTALLRVALEASLDGAARQTAAIAFKNAVKGSWQSKENRPSPIADGDKEAVRGVILDGIIHAPPAVRLQLEESVKNIIASDYPDHWPTLLPALQRSLASGDQSLVSGALRVLRIISRKYEYRDADDRGPLNAMVNGIFPTLLHVFQALLANPSPSPDLAELLKLCCKIFWSSTYLEIPAILATEEQFTGWMGALLALAGRAVPTEGMPEDSEGRKEWPWWKAKKWVYNVSYRLFTNLGRPSKSRSYDHDQQEHRHVKAFAERWRQECSLPFLSAVMNELTAVGRGAYISPRVANITLQYVTAAVDQPATWKVLKPHVQDIIKHVVFPMLAFNADDAMLWQDDPEEYVRKGYDVIEDLYSPKTAGMGLLAKVCTAKKAKKSELDPTMAYIVQLLGEFKAQGEGQASDELAGKVDGVLLAIGTLQDVLKKEPRYRTQLEPMLQHHVVPLFSSSRGHLRAKACWLAGQYADAPFSEGGGRGATFSALLQCVIAALGDPELPVRVDAAVAVREFVQELEEEGLSQLRPLVPTLLERFLAISQEVESEDVTASLEAVVTQFGPDMAPYAVGVVTALAQQFWGLMAEEEGAAAGADDDSDANFGALAGYSILNAISSVLDAVSAIPHLYAPLEDALFPILDRFTCQDGLDVFEEVTKIITYLTYYAPEITPRMWSLYPKLLHCMDTWAIDYFPDVLLPLDNYISRGSDVFLGAHQPSLLDMTNNTLQKVLAMGHGGSEEEAPDDAIISAAQLMSVIMQHCRGRVDHCIGPYLTIMAPHLTAEHDDRDVEDSLLVAFADALYYNAALTLRALSELGSLAKFMSKLGAAVGDTRENGTMRHFPSKRDKKIVILGLTSVLTVPSQALPPEVAGSLAQVSFGVLQVLLALKAQEEKGHGGSDASSSSDGLSKLTAGGDHYEAEEGSDDEDVDPEEIERLMREAARRAGHGDEDEDEWDSEVEWDSDDEDAEVASPIDAISPFVFFAEALQAVQSSDPGRFTTLVANFDAATQTAVQGMMAYAVELKAAQAAAAAAAAQGNGQ